MAGKHIDWKPIKTEYITTRVSYRQLSERYGVSIAQISRVSNREHWTEQREQYAHKCFKKAEVKAANKEANSLARLITATTKAIDVAMGALEDEHQFRRYIVTDSIGSVTSTVEKQFDKVDTKALKELTGVLKDLTGLVRDFYNIPTPAQAEAQRIAAARLELDRKKAESGEESGEPVEIVFTGETEAMSQ